MRVDNQAPLICSNKLAGFLLFSVLSTLVGCASDSFLTTDGVTGVTPTSPPSSAAATTKKPAPKPPVSNADRPSSTQNQSDANNKPSTKAASLPCNDVQACKNKGLETSTGTGFFITNDGTLITNHHVVAGAQALFVLINNRLTRAHIEALSEENDLAMLKVDAPSIPIPFSTTEPQKGAEVLALGFPNIDIQGSELKATVGHINSLTGINNDRKLIQFDAPVQPGSSGGPVINDIGQVVAVVRATLSTSGTAAQNVNYAVKMTYARTLDGFSALVSASHNGQKLSPQALVSTYEHSVVPIINYRKLKTAAPPKQVTPVKPKASNTPSPAQSANSETDATSRQEAQPSVPSILPVIKADELPRATQPSRSQYIYKERPQP